MGSDTNCNDSNYYLNQNNSVSNFYERLQSQSNLTNSDWIHNSEVETSRHQLCQDNNNEIKNSEPKNNRNYISNQINSHNWNFTSNPYRLYNDNPYGSILSSNSSTPVSTFVPSTSSSVENNTQLNVQSVQPHQIKRVFYQGLIKFI